MLGAPKDGARISANVRRLQMEAKARDQPPELYEDTTVPDVSRFRPTRVTFALRLLTCSLIVGVLIVAPHVPKIIENAPNRTLILMSGVVVFAFCLLFAMYRGANWARLCFLVLVIVSFPGEAARVIDLMPRNRPMAVVGTLQELIHIAALSMLFFGNAGSWFRSKGHRNEAAA
jgi:hypothetical protein